MSKLTMFLSTLAVLFIAVVLTGCSAGVDSTPPATPADQGPADDEGSATKDEHAGHDHGDHADHKEDAEKEKALADLSAEDRAAVEEQQICPVSGGSLWGMGKPYKTTVTDSSGKEHVVFLCCGGCEKELKSEPDKYLAKINK